VLGQGDRLQRTFESLHANLRRHHHPAPARVLERQELRRAGGRRQPQWAREVVPQHTCSAGRCGPRRPGESRRRLQVPGRLWEWPFPVRRGRLGVREWARLPRLGRKERRHLRGAELLQRGRRLHREGWKAGRLPGWPRVQVGVHLELFARLLRKVAPFPPHSLLLRLQIALMNGNDIPSATGSSISERSTSPYGPSSRFTDSAS
jgi:hypothetical protein